ncbi:MAG TPA: bifunctional diaminohydroxyphosphoribosylaminopyrimidine deaminase/5-amino-6-(5-phosphoribosylamino)uracil reductase RibD [Tepidisphaeraceae bacterium]|nr:bifunctional diaminohydroxyphosphoribosylaminopyrimidine deaminase/5-amino-6-(5-phosphoribosylamino)uracil reductase RibD [Tepidisphaeraceae bacterium]
MASPLSDLDRRMLARAARLAMNGRGQVEPNPMVGCVVVRDGQIIGEGFHERCGGPHAEPNALAACGQPPRGATAYVTLEPCCHENKRTPPCVPALIAAGLARVVVGCTDPNPQVNGRGVAQLRAAGIQIDEADDPACKQLLAPFIAGVVHRRPYVTLKWAQSADRKVAGPAGKLQRISNQRSHNMVHDLRSRCDAILVGIGTVMADDCLLTARDVPPLRPLLRIVLDSHLRLPMDSQLVRTTDTGRVIIICSKEAADQSGTRVPLAAAGVEIFPVSCAAPGRLDLRSAIEVISELGVTHLLVEPGPTLAQSFLEDDIWDRAWVFESPMNIGDAAAPTAPKTPPNPVASMALDGDVLTEFLNPAGVYFGLFPSADFVRATAGVV